MIDIVQHPNGKWFIALNPVRGKGGVLGFEYAWTGSTWTKTEARIHFFASASAAKKFVARNRLRIDAAYFEAPARAS